MKCTWLFQKPAVIVRAEQSINCADCGIFACPLVPTAAIFPSLDKHYAVAYRLFGGADIDCPAYERQILIRGTDRLASDYSESGNNRRERIRNSSEGGQIWRQPGRAGMSQ